MNYEFELTEENLKSSLINDTLKRNSRINVLLKLINSLTRNSIISIDGAWGTGKTVFVKQIEAINKYDFVDKKNNEIDLREIDNEIKDEFNSKYVVYYYNAWENDNHVDPLLSIIYKLINDFPKLRNVTVDLKSKKVPINLKKFLTTWSNGLIQAEEVETFEELVNNIYTVEEQKQAFNNLLDSLIPVDKKMLIIIDELDRCNPAFAINTIEAVKHFYDNDKIVFLVSSNCEQLKHTVSSFYGDNFDGYGYLNKVFNFIVSLENINPLNYAKSVLQKVETNKFWDLLALGIFEHYNFSMREIGRYVYYMDMLESYYYKNDLFSTENSLVKNVFMPYCLGLKLKNIEKYNDFLSGNDIEEFLLFYSKNKKCQKITNRIFGLKNDKMSETAPTTQDYIKAIYTQYFIEVNNEDDDSSIESRTIRDRLLEVLSMISSYSTINHQ